MNPFNEVSEVSEVRKPTQEVSNRSRGFENTTKDVNEPRHINTINEDKAGTYYGGVLYSKHVFRVNGEKVEGVFPRFDSEFNTRLPKNLWNASDNEQFKYCTEKLKQRIENDPEFAKRFTPRQIEQIMDGAPRISGLTWHHNEIPGKMQLVDSNTHGSCRHTGGRNIWGGGSACR